MLSLLTSKLRAGWATLPILAKGLVVGLVLLVVLRLLSYFHVPSNVAALLDRPFKQPIFVLQLQWLSAFMNRWGELVIFIMGFIIAWMIPSKADTQTRQILQIIRGNLRDFESVYQEVCQLLIEIKNDPDSCFIMVSQSPLLGADYYPGTDHDFYNLLNGRVHKKNRIVCLSPFHDMPENGVPPKKWLKAFYDDLAKYNPNGHAGTTDGQAVQSAEKMFSDAEKLISHLIPFEKTDVIFATSIPYQIFIRRKSDGTKKCVFLLNGWEAIKRDLPAGGFVSEDPIFLSLVEHSVEILLGTHRSIYELAFEHTKKILKECSLYAVKLGSPKTPDEVPSHEDSRVKKFTRHGRGFVVYPYVFDPDISESSDIMAEAVHRTIVALKKIKNSSDEKPLQVWDLGCGCGTLSVLAASCGNVKVKAVDINKFATACTKLNAQRNKFDASVEVYLNDSPEPAEVLEPFKDQKADLIMADLPFLNCYPYFKELNQETMHYLQLAYCDHEQKLNMEILKKAKDYLEQDGRLVISFSDLDSVDEFRSAILKEGWRIQEESEKPVLTNKHEWYAYVLTVNDP